MVYCFNCELAFATSAANDLVFAALLASVTTQLRFGAEQFEKAANKIGAFGIFIIMRYRMQTDAQAMADLVESQALLRPPRPGSFYRLHDCGQDGTGSCSVGTRRVW